ncbi:hypothetical protein NSE_0589 [Neorickettsia sennetsu str. Miyayama]|uniref:Uncharacterized protein n=1 Tax=Ehrlichia sennetsu (strain ATCC VR-367 / Miyayama) TaxID=222891 RepID=Q2GDH7_EHRS3|nr:hypothetical protein NSE_0589 [Neorickettsia sennetsu str. Miyayama]
MDFLNTKGINLSYFFMTRLFTKVHKAILGLNFTKTESRKIRKPSAANLYALAGVYKRE